MKREKAFRKINTCGADREVLLPTCTPTELRQDMTECSDLSVSTLKLTLCEWRSAGLRAALQPAWHLSENQWGRSCVGGLPEGIIRLQLKHPLESIGKAEWKAAPHSPSKRGFSLGHGARSCSRRQRPAEVLVSQRNQGFDKCKHDGGERCQPADWRCGAREHTVK